MSLIEALAVFVVFIDAGVYSSSSRFKTESHPFLCAVEPTNDICRTKSVPSTVSSQYEKNKRNKKRNAFNLYYMIEECTKCRAWDLLGYGNYCGFGGSGKPIDDIDRCCRNHDNCYTNVIEKNDCWQINVYLMPYDWKVRDGAPHCSDESNRCRREICYCDKAFTECLNRVGCP